MTAITNLPDLRPSLLLDFANSGRVDPRIKFTRASSATCFGPDGKLRTVAANVPRIDYDPVTGECRGLLVEEARTNLLMYSEQFDNAVWGNRNTSVTPNAITAPDGTLTADKLIATSVSDTHFNSQGLPSFTSGKTYTVSVFAKAGEYTWTRVYFGGNAFPASARSASFNLANGTLGAAPPGVISRISDAGNGWYRCSITVTAIGTASDNCGFSVQNADNANSTVFPGNDSDGIYIWGAQVEEGSFPTSYIPTTGSQVTRAGETALMSGTNFTSWHRQGEGTLLAESSIASYDKNAVSRHNTAFINDGTSQNHFGVRAYSDGVGNLAWDAYGRADGVVEFDTAHGTENTPNTLVKNAVTYIKDSVAGSVNGSVPSVDTSAEIPNVTQISFGSSHSSAVNTQHIRRVAYYPRRITNEQLQRLTA